MDTLVRAVAQDGRTRALAVVTTGTVEEARRRHDTLPTATAALGRGLTGAVLIGATLKAGSTATLRIIGDGPLGGLIADSTAEAGVRGYVANPQVDLPPTPARKLSVGAAVGRGTLHVTKDMGLRHPYHSSVPLRSGEIGEDLAYYFASSEQVPSAVALGVLVAPSGRVLASGGLLIQVLPGTADDVIAYLDRRTRALPAITTLVNDGMRPTDILQEACGDLALQFVDEMPVRFQCRCSRDKVKGVLLGLGAREVRQILAEQGRAEVHCRFCGERYEVGDAELREMLDGQDAG
ncbi:MAG: Hsp33 family molecular chaperone HslO [Armatimonadetes bacterium]|nr:Hsp33 family molecular chaperone HslO [Armatimonadota bacterium]